MNKRKRETVTFELEYWSGPESENRYTNMPVPPRYTAELVIGVRTNTGGPAQERVIKGRPQVHFAGSPRALEAFGKYLIALANVRTRDPAPHDHFESVRNDDGGTVHLIVHRMPPLRSRRRPQARRMEKPGGP